MFASRMYTNLINRDYRPIIIASLSRKNNMIIEQSYRFQFHKLGLSADKLGLWSIICVYRSTVNLAFHTHLLESFDSYCKREVIKMIGYS